MTSKERPTVLIVDDELPVLRAVQRVLSTEFHVVAVTDGNEALARVERGEAYDAIVCDFTMPRLDGSQFFERLRALDEKLAAHVIFVTGGVLSARALSFLDSIGNARLYKPFRPAELRDAVRAAISSAQAA